MTNKEILESWGVETRESMLACDTDLTLQNTLEMMDEVRRDEREKLQGVDVWISWDSSNRISNPYLSDTKPIAIEKKFGIYYDVEEGSQIYGFNPDLAANYLGLKQGECAKFKIVRQP